MTAAETGDVLFGEVVGEELFSFCTTACKCACADLDRASVGVAVEDDPPPLRRPVVAVRAGKVLALLNGALCPHVLYGSERDENFTGDPFGAKVAACNFAAQAGNTDAAVGKRELRGNIEPQWRCGRDRFRRWDTPWYARLALLVALGPAQEAVGQPVARSRR